MIPFPDKKYNIIYADPPWSYENKTLGRDLNAGAADKYDTMSLRDIINLPVKSISDKNCFLFMWAVVPQLPEAFEVMKAWGFKYKTMLTWKKEYNLIGGKGMGFWFSGQTEHLLFGVKGNVKAFKSMKPNHYSFEVKKHSKKPDKFRELIVEVAGDIPRIELFARTKIHGWDTWGNDEKLKLEPLESFYNA